MSSALYDSGREGFLDGSINWSTGSIKTMLLLSSYTFSAAHKFVSDIVSGDNGRSAALTSKTVTAGVANAAATTLNATAATASKALALYQDTGTDSTSRVIAYIDAATGLPFTPAAAQAVAITWDSGANKIFKL